VRKKVLGFVVQSAEYRKQDQSSIPLCFAYWIQPSEKMV
jgi:hypothetical protein